MILLKFYSRLEKDSSKYGFVSYLFAIFFMLHLIIYVKRVKIKTHVERSGVKWWKSPTKWSM